jgi:preprotein translocase subunit YajC
MSTLLLLLLFVLAWVVLILPKQRELKRHNALVASLDVGEEVMTGAGIYGTITGVEGDVVWLEIAPDLEIKVAKRAIASKVVGPVGEDEDEDEDEDQDELAGDVDDPGDVDDLADAEIVDDGLAPADRGTDVEDLSIRPADDDRPDGRP